MKSTDAQLDELKLSLARLEGKVDALLMILRRGPDMAPSPPSEANPVLSRLASLTVRQHGALQMIILGRSNKDIADRFEVTENTAKVYVRGIASKLKVRTRVEIVRVANPEYSQCPPEIYKKTAGLPKGWGDTYEGGLTWFSESGRGKKARSAARPPKRS